MTAFDAFLSQTGAGLRPSAIRQMGALLASSRDIVSFAPGYPAEELFPWAAFRLIADELLQGRDGSVLQYGATRGYRPLRDAVTSIMQDRGVATSADRIVVTTGSQQGLDLVARVLIDPGDVILMELPSYTGAITAFQAVGAAMVGVRQDEDGLDLDHLETTLVRLRGEGRRVKFLYTVPNFQNPTGQLVSAARRQAIVAWAERRDLLVLEDDPYRDLFFTDVTTEAETRPMAADDGTDRVIYLSSFSKTLAPGLRVGWISAAPALAVRFELAKQAEDLSTGILDQRIVHEACRRGVLDAHLPKLREHYRHKRDVMLEALTSELGEHVSWRAPRGGFFVWVRLGSSLGAQSLLERAQANGVIYVVGTAFHVDGGGDDHIRLSFSSPSPARIREGVSRLAAAVRAELGAAAHLAAVRE